MLSKQIFIEDLKPKDTVQSTFMVKSKDLAVSRNAKPYLTITLSDKTGDLDCRVWEDAEGLSQTFGEGDIVAIAGKTHTFQNRLQLVIQQLAPVPAEQIELSDYLPAASGDLQQLYAELLAIFDQMGDPWIRKLGLALLEDPDIAKRYQVCPAAKTIHHAFIGGLLTHSRQLIRMVDALVPLYQGIQRDVLVFGAAFHDFGKIYELSWEKCFGYTDEGKLVGHIAIAVSLIDRKIRQIEGFPESLEWQLKHLILSHHGKLEYGSPKRPATLEAVILAYIDDLDSKIDSIQSQLRSTPENTRWTAYHRAYDQYYYKPETKV